MPSKYAQIADCADSSVTVTQKNVDDADVYVDGVLFERGINPVDVVLPSARLTTLAATWAIRLAAIEGAIGENSPLIAKAREYEKTASQLAGTLSRESLGLSVPTGAGFGNVILGRG